jgi:hypothetical protein
MQMRIRYDFEGPIGVSRTTYGTASGENVRVVIDKDNFKFEIVNHDGKAIVQGGKTKNYIVLLRQAKRALIALGAGFDTEDRNRDYGIIRKRIKRKSNKLKGRK